MSQSSGRLFLSTSALSNIHITLASKSPRRREILDMMGLAGKYDTTPSPCDEAALQKELRGQKDLLPEQYVQILSDEKAKAVRPPPFPKSKKINFVIGSDTIVDYEGDILEKPLDQNDANRMLSNLSGKWHKVHTGVAIHAYYGNNLETISDKKCFTETTLVKFFELSDKDINAYILTGEPMDKAGSYGIQGIGGQMVEEIQGDFFAVMGLPMHRLSVEMAKLVQKLENK